MNPLRFKKIPSAGKPDTLPQTLDRNRIFILPTRYGLLFMVVVFAMLGGAMNYNNNLGFIMTFLLGGIGVVSILHTYKNLAGMKILSVRTRPVFAGEQAALEVCIQVLGLSRSAISFRLGAEREILVTKDLDSDRENRVLLHYATQQRGVHPVPLIRIFTSYPLGLFNAWSNLLIDTEIIVYPRPLAGPFLWSRGDSGNEKRERAAVYGSDDFQGLKAYQPGDPLKRISWKTFSRGQGLVTKIFSSMTPSGIVLDWHAFKDPDVERRLSHMSSAILGADREHLSYGLNLPGKMISQGKGDAHKHRCLKALALFSTEKPER